MPRRKVTAPQKENGAGDYEIGYGRPPIHSQFRPGQSGYPAGRRKGVRNLKTDVMRTLKTPVKVKEGGRSKTMSTQEGILLVLREKALRGDARALNAFVALALRYNSDPGEIGPTQGLAADDQAILAAYAAEVAAAATAPANTQSKHRACSNKKARK
jgi:hypothetical protein